MVVFFRLHPYCILEHVDDDIIFWEKKRSMKMFVDKIISCDHPNIKEKNIIYMYIQNVLQNGILSRYLYNYYPVIQIVF